MKVFKEENKLGPTAVHHMVSLVLFSYSCTMPSAFCLLYTVAAVLHCCCNLFYLVDGFDSLTYEWACIWYNLWMVAVGTILLFEYCRRR